MRPLVITTALLLSAAASAEPVSRRALVVGANDGGAGLEVLKYAHNDAWRVSEVFESMGGFDDGSVQVLTSPSADQLAEVLADIATEMEASDDETLFLFYYSGHADARGLQLYDDIYAYEDLKAAIRAIGADVHLGVLDACRSGAVTRVKGATVDAPFLQEGLDAEGEAWIAASAEDEDAQESARLQGSFFTHYLVSGLRGAADTGDGWVSLNEAYSYAYDRTVARTAGTDAGTQHPAYDFRLQGNGDLKLTEVQAATAHIVLPIAVDGEVTVLRQTDNLPVAEVAKLDDREIILALEPGTYVLKRRIDGKHMDVTVHLSEGSEVVVDRWSDTLGEEGTEKGASVEFPAMELPDDPPPDDVENKKLIQEDDDAVFIRIPKTFPDMPDLKWKPPQVDLKNQPAMAGIGSAILPGLGQAYQGRWADGLGFFLGTAVLNGGAWGLTALDRPTSLSSGAVTGPNIFTLAGLALYAWNINDASWGAKIRKDEDRVWHREPGGFTLSAETVWSGDLGYPEASGIAADWLLAPGFSIGLDRTGWVAVHPDDRDPERPDGGVLRTGVRAMVGVEAEHWRPAAFLAAGVAIRPTGEQVGWREIYSGGANLRYYPTPRFFLQGEARLELDRLEGVGFAGGAGLGFHIGK